MWLRLRRLFSDNLFHNSLHTMVVRGASVLFSITALLLLARMLNTVSQFGEIAFGYGVARLMATLLSFGSQGILPRSIAQHSPAKTKLLMAYKLRKEFLWRGCTIACILVLIFTLYEYLRWASINVEAIAFSSLAPMTFLTIHQSFLISLKKIKLANYLQLFPTALWAIILLFLYFSHIKSPALFALTAPLSILTVCAFSYVKLPKKAFHSRQALKKLHHSIKFSSVIMFSFMLGVVVINQRIDLIILKLFSNNLQIALYSVASQWSILIAFVLSAINTSILSEVADLYQKNKMLLLAKYISKSTKIVSALTFPVLLILLIGAPYVFALYGDFYTQSYYLLLILIAGQIINVFTGSVGVILMMTHHEKIVAKIQFLSIVVNFIVSAILAPHIGAYGAAIGATVAMVLWNIILYFIVKQKLNIDTTLLSIWKLRNAPERIYEKKT